MGDENDLTINITAVDQASQTLEGVAEAAEGMATTIGEVAASIQDSMDAAFSATEEAAIDAAMSTLNAWTDAGVGIDEAMAGVAESADEAFSEIPDAAIAAANSTVAGWEDSLTELQEMMSEANLTYDEVMADMAEAAGVSASEMAKEWDTAFAGMAAGAEKGAATSTSAMQGMHSYFQLLIGGYLLQQAGQALTSGVSDVLTAAAGDPTKLAQLQDQMKELQAQREKLEQPISGKGKTTGVLQSDEAEQAAQLSTVSEKIKELQPQIAQLTQAQEMGGQAAKDYAKAQGDLAQAWQNFLGSAGTPALEFFAQAMEKVAGVVTEITAWVQAHPKWAEALTIAAALLGGILLVVGALLIALAPLIIIIGLFGGTFTAATVGIAIGIAGLILEFGILVGAVLANWTSIKTTIGNALDAIVNFVKDHWEAIVQILVPGMGTLVVLLYNNWTTIKSDIEKAWTWISDFIMGIWNGIVSGIQTAITAIQDLINNLLSSWRQVTSAVSSVGGSLGSAGSAVLGALPHFADGGIVSSPTLALVGEAGPEAIIPLSAFNGGSTLGGGGGIGGAGNIVINIGSLAGTDESAARRFADLVARNLQRNIKL